MIFQLLPTEEAKKAGGVESADDILNKVHGGEKKEAAKAEEDADLD